MPTIPTKSATLAAKSVRAVKVLASNAPKLDFDGFDYPPITQKNVPPKSFDEYARCLFGKKGYGKSTLASQFPDHLTLMYEPNRRNLGIWMQPIKKFTAQQIREGADDTWVRLTNSIDRMLNDQTVKGLNFDSVDLCYQTCYQHVLFKHGLNAPSDAGKASADIWNEVRDEFAAFFDALIETRLSINFLSHVKTRETEELDGGKFDMREPSCTPACLQYIKQACDFVFFYGPYGGKRAIQIRDEGSNAFVACGAENYFMQPDGKPIFYLEMPGLLEQKETGISGYDVLKKAFNNECWDINTPEEERKATPATKAITVPSRTATPTAKPAVGARPPVRPVP